MKFFKSSILIILLSFFAPISSAQTKATDLLQQQTEERIQEIIRESPAVTGVVAIDLSNGRKIAFNEDILFPQASAIKIPILAEVYRQAHAGKFSLSDKREIKPENIVGGTGIIKDLENAEALSIKNLGILMIVLSDNSATNSLIDLVGMPELNNSLEQLGFKHTRLSRKMMNSAASARGEENVSTPKEAAEFMQMLYNGKFINQAVSGELVSILEKTPREDSRLAGGIPENMKIAFKPGGIPGVSVEWAIVLLKERPYAVAVMESMKVKSESEDVMEKLSEVLYQYYWRLGNASEYGTYVDPDLMRSGN